MKRKQRKPVTLLGWEIKQKISERKMSQEEFCRKYNIPQYRLSNIIRGVRPAKPQREKIMQILDIPEEDVQQRKAE